LSDEVLLDVLKFVDGNTLHMASNLAGNGTILRRILNNDLDKLPLKVHSEGVEILSDRVVISENANYWRPGQHHTRNRIDLDVKEMVMHIFTSMITVEWLG
jgi:hypothetical protein